MLEISKVCPQAQVSNPSSSNKCPPPFLQPLVVFGVSWLFGAAFYVLGHISSYTSDNCNVLLSG